MNLSDLESIEMMKVYYPTKQEFTNPVNYVEKLFLEGAQKYGCVKIVPPKDFQPPIALDLNSSKKFPTRYQEL